MQNTRFFALIPLLALVAVGPARTAPEEAPTFRFGGSRLALTFDATSGALVGLAAGDTPLAAGGASDPSLDINLNGRWLVSDDRGAFRLLRREEDAQHGTLTLVRAAGPWEVTESYALAPDAPRVTRRVSLVYRGSERAKLRGVRFVTPGVVAPPSGFYAFPRAYPPARYPFAAMQEGRQRGTGVPLAPALAQVAPGRTLLWVSDGRTDHVRTTFREGKGRFSVFQHFEALGWVKPGGTQEVGSATLEVVPAPYERALPALWAWMLRGGIHVPTDRPDWMRDAVLYSFHPGGTIGSDFHDLGGFRAATEQLLPSLPALGVNSIWIMPVEDVAVYHPRDYYKFQAGLGTAEEFRAMVAKAHALGLHVLQDLVPHGGRSDFPRAKEHPEWLVRDEAGQSPDYWCFDFAWPAWQRYIADVATYYVKQYDVDGYRVDACGGSKIPNWNPEIPYARASLSQIPGGLGMLHGIRQSVKALKPREGAVLGEVEGAPYLAETDADYDFTFCYQVLPDLRRVPPAQFVERLQTWLEEQKYTDPPGALRLRHVESHDSLRAQGWYGVAPMRALVALSAWIDGIPLVYHEMEVGHTPALRRIFDIRRRFPELRRGEAFYQAVTTRTGGVFTCLRRVGREAGIVVINLNPRPVQATLALPASAVGLRPGDPCVVHDAWSGRTLTTRGKALGQLPCRLEPYGATFLAIRPNARALPAPIASPARPAGAKTAAVPHPTAPGPLRVTTGDATVTVANGHYRLTLDRRTGLPRGLAGPSGQPLLDAGDVLLDAGLARPAGPAALRQSARGAERELEFTARLPEGGYTLRYQVGTGAGIRVECLFDGPKAETALLLPFPGAAAWSVDTIEGRLEDTFRTRHRSGEVLPQSIYWRPQGTDILWQAETTPLRPGGEGIVARRADGWGVAVGVEDLLGAPPAALQLLDKCAGREGLHLRAAWAHEGTPADPSPAATPRRFALRLTALAPGSSAPSAPSDIPPGVSLRHTGLDWVVENAHYRAVIRRTGGALRELWAKQPRERLVLSEGDVYADRGFAAEQKRFDTANDVEAGVRLERLGDALVLRFGGRLRGSYRFDLARPAVEYAQEYAFSAGPSLRHTWAVRSARAIHDGEGFLSAIWQVPEGAAFTFRRGESLLAAGKARPSSGRQGQTAALSSPAAPDTILLTDEAGPVATFSGLETHGGALRNVFVDGRLLFAAWLDGQHENLEAGRWYEASAVVTPGGDSPAAVLPPRWQHAPAPLAAGLRDGSFEAGGCAETSLTTGRPVRLSGAAQGTAWLAPTAGGALTPEAAHDGRVSAKITNASGSYLLWRQALDAAAYPPGTRLRLSAWVKAENVKRGDVAWKMGTLRLAVLGAQTTYASAADFEGTFDWRRLEGEVVVPEGAQPLEVQVGLNGSTGTCWIDEVKLEAVR